MTVTPLMVDLYGRNVVVIGGGRVAERRVHSLLESGASLTIISPEIKESLRDLCKEGLLNWKQKHFVPEDLDEAFFIIVATNNSVVNQAVIHASPPNSLLNVAAGAEQGNVHFPSHFKRGKLSMSISTNGASPLLSAKIKSQLQTTYDKSYGDYVDFLYESRQMIKHAPLTRMEQRLLLKELLSEDFQNKNKQRETIDWLKQLSERGYT